MLIYKLQSSDAFEQWHKPVITHTYLNQIVLFITHDSQLSMQSDNIQSGTQRHKDAIWAWQGSECFATSQH